MLTFGFAALPEMSLTNGRRADVVGLSAAGDDLDRRGEVVPGRLCASTRSGRSTVIFPTRCSSRWRRASPSTILPADTGLILADRYGGEIVRPAPETRLAAARRKAMTLRFARIAAAGLQALDPDLAWSCSGKIPAHAPKWESPPYFGARLARMRCKVRRCMLRRRAVSDTLRLHSSYTR